MIKVCGFRLSNYHNKVLIALHEKGIAFEEDCNVKPSQKPEYLGLSPMGKVPYAEVDGTRLCESEVILEYLEDAYPQKPLLPKDPVARAKVRELVTVLELHVELVARRLYGGLFAGATLSESAKQSVAKELAKSVYVVLTEQVAFNQQFKGTPLTRQKQAQWPRRASPSA